MCLFAVQFVNGGVAGSVIYGPYDFNPGSTRVHNAAGATQPAPLLIFGLPSLSFFFQFSPSYSVLLLLAVYLRSNGEAFSAMDGPFGMRLLRTSFYYYIICYIYFLAAPVYFHIQSNFST